MSESDGSGFDGLVSFLPVAFGILCFVAYVGGSWHAFVAHSVGAGLASVLLALPAFYYFLEMFAHS